jgi:hypothetical protein
MRAIVFAVVAILLAAPAAAQAQSTPKSNSALDQYTETLPGPGGDKPSNHLGGGGGGGGGGNLPPGVFEELQSHGAAGVGAGTLAQATPGVGQNGNADAAAGGPNGKAAAGKHAIRGETRNEDGGSSLTDVLSALGGSDSGGLCIFLPILLGATLVAVVAVAVGRLRRRGQPGGA